MFIWTRPINKPPLQGEELWVLDDALKEEKMMKRLMKPKEWGKFAIIGLTVFFGTTLISGVIHGIYDFDAGIITLSTAIGATISAFAGQLIVENTLERK